MEIQTNYSDNGWNLISQNQYSGIKTYVRFNDEGQVIVRKTQPVKETLDRNTALNNDWGGWQGKEDAIVASIPASVMWNWKENGMLDAEGEDTKKLFQILNSNEFSKLRTGGGQL